MNSDSIGQEPDLFPELPRGKKRKVSQQDMLSSTLRLIRDRSGVSTPEIASKIRVPVRTVEKWVQADRKPPEWCCRMILDELWRFWPDCRVN